MNKPLSSIQSALKKDGFRIDSQRKDGKLQFVNYINTKMKVQDWKEGERIDEYYVVKYDGTISSISFDFLPINKQISAVNNMMVQYKSFQKSLLKNGFEHVGLLKEKDHNIYYFINKESEVIISVEEYFIAGEETTVAVIPIGYAISINMDYMKYVNTYYYFDKTEESSAKDYLKKNPNEKIKE